MHEKCVQSLVMGPVSIQLLSVEYAMLGGGPWPCPRLPAFTLARELRPSAVAKDVVTEAEAEAKWASVIIWLPSLSFFFFFRFDF